MADIISRIVLQATGGDQVAREIQKVTTAYKSAGTAAKGMGSDGASVSDPFTRAVSSSDTPASTQTRRERNDMEEAKARNRLAYNRSLGGYAQQAAVGGTAVIPGMQRGDVFATAGGAMTGAQGVLGGLGGIALKALPLAAGAGLLMAGLGKLAGNEWERVQSMWGAGVSQRLGMGYTSARGLAIEEMRGGVPEEMLMGSLRAFGQAGGRMNQDVFSRNIRRMQSYGVAADAGMGLSATLGRAGYSGTITAGTYQTLESAFGGGRLGTLFQGIGQIIEESLAKGATKASVTLGGGIVNAAEAVAGQISGYHQFGNLSMEGALALYQQTQERSRQAANLSTPMDVATFRAYRKPGESIFSTRLRMEQDPQAVLQSQLKMLESRYGGRSDLIREALFKSGYSPSQAEAIFSSRDALAKGEQVSVAKLREFETGLAGDEEAVKGYQVRQMQVLEGVEKAINDFHNNILSGLNKIISGEVKVPDSDVQTGNKIVGELMKNNELQTQIMQGQIQGYADIVDAVKQAETIRQTQELTPQQKAQQALQQGMSGAR